MGEIVKELSLGLIGPLYSIVIILAIITFIYVLCVKLWNKRVAKNKGLNSIYTCPKCGSYLTVKNGRFGKFMGCSNFPKCRYTRKS